MIQTKAHTIWKRMRAFSESRQRARARTLPIKNRSVLLPFSQLRI